MMSQRPGWARKDLIERLQYLLYKYKHKKYKYKQKKYKYKHKKYNYKHKKYNIIYTNTRNTNTTIHDGKIKR